LVAREETGPWERGWEWLAIERKERSNKTRRKEQLLLYGEVCAKNRTLPEMLSCRKKKEGGDVYAEWGERRTGKKKWGMRCKANEATGS